MNRQVQRPQPQRVDQGLAQAAETVLGDSVHSTVRTRMRQLPARLRASGLATTYAFLLSKSGDGNDVAKAYKRVTEAIAEHVTSNGFGKGTWHANNFLQKLANLDLASYTRLSAEVDALAIWLSRLADALPLSDARPATREGGRSPEQN